MLSKNVKTINGVIAPREKCRKIKGAYYIENEDCFLLQNIEGISQWYRKENEDVYLNFDTNRYGLLSVDNPIYGIVDIENDNLIFGYYNHNPCENTKIGMHDGTVCNIRSIGLVNHNSDFHYSKYHAMYCKNKNDVVNEVRRGKGLYSYGRGGAVRDYSSSTMMSKKVDNFWKYNTQDFSKNPISDIINKYTFGVEFETEAGHVPEPDLWKNGLIVLRDGSIHGDEFATIPLQYNLGLKKLIDCANLLQSGCSISKYCSVHIHIGGVKPTFKSVWAIYMTSLILENEVYSLFPEALRNSGEFKRQDYCAPLRRFNVRKDDDIETKFNTLFNYYSLGHRFTHFGDEHPVANIEHHKWNLGQPRYHWVSLMPFLFGNKQTVEFRCHNATLNPEKIINWLLITSSILKYAEDHQDDFINQTPRSYTELTLKDVLKYNVNDSKVLEYLNNYIDIRKQQFKDGNDRQGDKEIQNDSSFNLDRSFIVNLINN